MGPKQVNKKDAAANTSFFKQSQKRNNFQIEMKFWRPSYKGLHLTIDLSNHFSMKLAQQHEIGTAKFVIGGRLDLLMHLVFASIGRSCYIWHDDIWRCNTCTE